MTDPIDPRVETPEEVRDRVLEAARFIDPDHLGTTDDCGFSPFGDDASTSRDIAFAKIRARDRRHRHGVGRARSLKRRTARRRVWFNPSVRRPGHLLGGALAVCALAAGTITACGGGGDDGAASALDAPHFVEEPGAIDHRYDGDFQYFVGGGVAAFDCDDDGRSDLFFAGGSAAGGAVPQRQPDRRGAALHRSCASPVTDLTAVTGAYPLDIDGDGHSDLAVLRVGEDVVLRGLGDCRFERANESLGIDDGDTLDGRLQRHVGGHRTRLPTLAFGDYLVPGPRATATTAGSCGPTPSGDGYAPPIALSPGYCTLSMLFSDWSRTGERDLRMSNDRHYYRDGEEQLWQHRRPARRRAPYTEADGWQPLQIWGMGIASQDVTGDGYPEVFLTSQGDNKLQTLADGPDQPTYEDIALERGATAHRPFTGGDVLPSTAWHAEFADVNNDGVPDLFVTKGNVEAQAGLRHARSEQPVDRAGRRHVRRGRRGRRDRQLRPGPRRRPRRPQPRRAARSRRRQPRRAGRRCGATSARGDADAPAADGPLGRRPAPSAGAQRRRHRRVGRGAGRRPHDQAHEVTVGGGHASGRARLAPPRARRRPTAPRSASSGPTARSVRG